MCVYLLCLQLTGLINDVSGRAGVPSSAAAAGYVVDPDSKVSSTQNLLDLLQHTAKLEARAKMLESNEITLRDRLDRETEAREKADRALAAKQEVRYMLIFILHFNHIIFLSHNGRSWRKFSSSARNLQVAWKRSVSDQREK